MADEEVSRCDRCRNQHFAVRRGRGKGKEPGIEDMCKALMPQYPISGDATCCNFGSKYIEYPLIVSSIDNQFDNLYSLYECGTLVKISPCSKEYNGKTYLGILLGDLPKGVIIFHSKATGVLIISPYANPAVFVPELGKIIYGCESWWCRIDNPEDLKDITTDDIENTWYVQMLKEMMAKTAEAK